MKKQITAIALAASMLPTATAFGKEYSAQINMNADGDIEYSSNYLSTDSCDMYTAVYDLSGTLKALQKNIPSGTIPLSKGNIYNAAVYFWEKGGAMPLRSPVRANNLRINSIYTASTITPERGNSAISVSNTGITTAYGNTTSFSASLAPADKNADEAARGMYRYLDAVSRSGAVLFGQENAISHKAGASNLSESDVKDVTGDYPAVFGLDTLSLVGAEYSAWSCNNRYVTKFAQTPAGNVSAAAYLTNKAIESGSIVTLSSHMPNFSHVEQITPKGGETYAKYNFNVYTPDPVSNDDTMNNIMPGGKYSVMYTAFLDMIADYAKQVNGTILFRPFHENTGSWWWWGANFCTAEKYKEVYAYTADYLKNKGVHNMLYVYSPGSEFNSASYYLDRYPGDDYIDIVGFDMYHDNPDGTDSWRRTLAGKLSILADFAKSHGKVCALTETGVSTRNVPDNNALQKYNNPDKDWYLEILDTISAYPVSYFMVWANWGENSSFYTPYVKEINSDGSLYCHEMTDNFISFYNDPRSVFASDQEGLY